MRWRVRPRRDGSSRTIPRDRGPGGRSGPVPAIPCGAHWRRPSHRGPAAARAPPCDAWHRRSGRARRSAQLPGRRLRARMPGSRFGHRPRSPGRASGRRACWSRGSVGGRASPSATATAGWRRRLQCASTDRARALRPSLAAGSPGGRPEASRSPAVPQRARRRRRSRRPGGRRDGRRAPRNVARRAERVEQRRESRERAGATLSGCEAAHDRNARVRGFGGRRPSSCRQLPSPAVEILGGAAGELEKGREAWQWVRADAAVRLDRHRAGALAGGCDADEAQPGR